MIWGPVLGMAGLAVGTRALTEVTSTATFGETKLVQAASGLSVALAARPLAQFAMRELHEARAEGRQQAFEQFASRAQLRLGLVLALLSTISLLASGVLGLPITPTAAVAAGVFVLAEVVISMDLALALTRNEQRLVSIADAARQWGLPLVAAATMVLAGDSASLFVVSQGVFTLVCVAAVRKYAQSDSSTPPTPSERARWTREARRFALPMLGSGLFNWIMSLGDRYLLAIQCTPEEVGRYSAVYGLVSMPIVAAGGMLARALFPLVFRAAARGDKAAQSAMLSWMFGVASAVGVMAILVTVVAGPSVLSLLLAPGYREGAQPLLLWLAAGHACLIVSYSIDMKAYAQKATKAFTIAAGLSAVVNIGCNLVWIPKYRAVGAAMATFFGYLVYLIAITLVLRRREQSTDEPSQPQ